MGEATFERATIDHAEALAETMRDEDAAECRALGQEPLDALVQSIDESTVAFAVLFGGEVGCLFGAMPEPVGVPLLGEPDVWIAWLLTGRAVSRNPKTFMRACRTGLGYLLERYPVLVNRIDARYHASVRWARHLGFTIGYAEPVGPSGALFHPVYIRRPNGKLS